MHTILLFTRLFIFNLKSALRGVYSKTDSKHKSHDNFYDLYTVKNYITLVIIQRNIVTSTLIDYYNILGIIVNLLL